MLARPCPKPQPQIWDLSPDMRDQWEIDRSEVQLIRKLGQGNFGEVWYGEYMLMNKSLVQLLSKVDIIINNYSLTSGLNQSYLPKDQTGNFMHHR